MITSLTESGARGNRQRATTNTAACTASGNPCRMANQWSRGADGAAPYQTSQDVGHHAHGPLKGPGVKALLHGELAGVVALDPHQLLWPGAQLLLPLGRLLLGTVAPDKQAPTNEQLGQVNDLGEKPGRVGRGACLLSRAPAITGPTYLVIHRASLPHAAQVLRHESRVVRKVLDKVLPPDVLDPEDERTRRDPKCRKGHERDNGASQWNQLLQKEMSFYMERSGREKCSG